MKKLSLAILLSCAGCASSQVPTASPNAAVASKAQTALALARKAAGSDPYLLQTQRLMCREKGADGKLLNTPMATNANVEPTQVFDNVFFVGGESNGGWLITTTDGYILLDAMYGNSPEKTIIPGMQKFGLDPAKIKYILITHAGPDHVGGASYFQEKYETRIIMHNADWNAILEPQPGSWLPRLAELRQSGQFDKIPEPERDWAGPPRRDLDGGDGQKLTLGGTTITMVHTPRVAGGGGLSYVIPVTDKGKPHVWVTWGNTGLPRALSDKHLYRQSLQHFKDYADQAGADVVMSSHPFVDGSIKRMTELTGRKTGQPNPFVIGKQSVARFNDILDSCASLEIAELQDRQDRPTPPAKQ